MNHHNSKIIVTYDATDKLSKQVYESLPTIKEKNNSNMKVLNAAVAQILNSKHVQAYTQNM